MKLSSINRLLINNRAVILAISILLIIIVINLIVASFAADRLQTAAEAKGMDSVYGWTILLGILCGLLGIAVCALIVIAMPAKAKNSDSDNTNDFDLDQILDSRKK